jgi:hypothetical protein
MWSLFIDDERFPKDNSKNYVIARSMEEAINLIEQHGCPNYISFDHDLGCDEQNTPSPTGYDFAHWLVNSDIDGKINIPEGFQFNVHSANPTGAANIQALVSNYLAFKARQ